MSILKELSFQPMLITDVFKTVQASKAWYDKSKLLLSGVAEYPFVSRTKSGNGVDIFCSRQVKDPEPGNALTIGLDTQTIGYQPVSFYTGQNIQVLRHPLLTQESALVLISLLQAQMGKFSWGGNGVTLGRLKKTRIMVPTIMQDGTTVVDWSGLDKLGQELIQETSLNVHRIRDTHPDEDSTLPELKFAPMLITDAMYVMHEP